MITKEGKFTNKLEDAIHTKGFVYECDEVIYIVKVKGNNYIVDVWNKLVNEMEYEELKLEKIGNHKFKYTQLPPLFATDLLYNKNYNSIQQALNAWGEFMENY